MFKKNKLSLIISSVVIMLPTVFGLIFYDALGKGMGDYAGKSVGGRGFVVFALPIILLFTHWLCIIMTSLDKHNVEQSGKVTAMVLWIIPVLSIFVSTVFYSVLLGKKIDIMLIAVILFSALFIFIGNYMPKCKRNSVIGVKTYHTLSSDENWSKTHRLAGILWFFGGLVMLCGLFLKAKAAFILMIAVIAVAVVVPAVYSWLYYKKQVARGDELSLADFSGIGKRGGKISAVICVAILALVAVLMFTGNVEVQFGETSITVEATYSGNITVNYADIDEIEYRENGVPGTRVVGFASARLLTGMFQNDEFGNYARYTYTRSESAIVLTVGDDIIVISDKSAEETKALYDKLTEQK